MSLPTGIGMTSDRTRARMVDVLRRTGIRDERVLAAMMEIPRHLFVEPGIASRAYEDTPLPIGHGQTISSPSVVAMMTQLLLEKGPVAKVLEIGTGCGYAAAVLARIFGIVISVERVRALHELARNNLRPLRIANLRLVFGDGSTGVPSEAPFDAICAAAAGEQLPPAWVEQLKPGGRIVAPLGGTEQQMTVVGKDDSGRVTRRTTEAVKFVPLRSGTA